jgi:1-acyl-sn-glycerol-3-phosphate acyltransferase
MSQFTLLRHRRFGPFFWTQFLGALNDNLFKNSLVILVAFGTASATLDADTLVNLAGGIFILPFFLFSPTAGQLADKFEKARLVRAVKLLEIAIMAIAAVGFARRSVPLLLTALFLMGCHSTLFGPVKYSILPQHLREEELVGGNALVEMGTFIAILLGTIAGGVLMSLHPWGPTIASAACLAIAVAGWATSLRVPPAPATDPDLRIEWNIFAEMRRTFDLTRANRTVFLSILGVSWFWFFGALLLAQFPALGRDVLGGNEHLVTLLLTVFSVGIGLGCLLCERLSGEKIEIGLVPFGSIGLTLFVLDLFFATRGAGAAPGTVGALGFLATFHGWRIVADLVLIGTFGGFYIVPLLALVQNRSEPSHRSRIIAGNNLVSAGFMVLAAGAGIGLRAAGVGIPTLFLLTALVNAGVAVYIYTLVPEFLMRFLIWMLVHTVYRVRQRGLEHVPEEGPAVLVCNHVSFVDALVIAAACRRPVRFVMDHNIFRIPVLNFVFRTGRAIPIASQKENPAMKEAAFEEVERALTAGDLVCIFPEGQITRTGDLNPFRGGVERMIAKNPVPVVPMALRGLWGSFFSRMGGHAMRHPFRRFWSQIELVAGAAVPPGDASVAFLQTQVLALRGDLR